MCHVVTTVCNTL